MKRISRKRGAILITALACLLIVMALLGGMLLAALRMQRQLPVERDLRQCDLLLQAGIDRAHLRDGTAADYRGETWELPADAVSRTADGRVTIEISSGSNDPSPQIKVVAEYPIGSERSIRRSRQFAFPTKTNPSEE